MIEFRDRFQSLNTTIAPLIQEYFVENYGEKGDFISELTIEELLMLRDNLIKYGDLLDEWIEENKGDWNDDLHNSFRFLDLCINVKMDLSDMQNPYHYRHEDYLNYLKKNNLAGFDFE